MKSILIVVLFSVSFLSAKTQSAPIAATPDAQRRALIDSLMKITKYKDYFQSYCDKQIDNAAEIFSWNEDLVRRKKVAVSFDAFKDYTVYNWFSSLKKEDLVSLITLFHKLNAGKYSTFLVTHSGIQSNLELFVKQYLK